ncbi:MAG: hypothetical protein JNL90_14015 [Planctomycetes bacterium]|nr:hypothetical protein [Planctomycetota bacterium]
MNPRALAYRVILALLLVIAALSAACIVLWKRQAADGADASGSAPLRALDDPEVRRAAIAELVARGGGGWDTFADPAVGRLLQPSAEGKIGVIPVVSNQYGLRERPFVLPKPAGTKRIVLLGDSFVFGEGVPAGDRLGVFLERFLLERWPAPRPEIEVLHVGLDTWNALAEATFVRRQLALLAPDAVVQVLVRNDLEDNVGARGFGAMADVNPLHPERGDGIFQVRFPQRAFDLLQPNWIQHGLDWESRERFREAGDALVALAAAVEQQGGRYLLFCNYSGLLPAARKFLGSRLRPEQWFELPTEFTRDARWRLGPDDAHWNRAGHERIAQVLYALLLERGLLPAAKLQPWPEASALAKEYGDAGRAEGDAEFRADRVPGKRRIDPFLDFRALDHESGAQVHGGVVAGGEAGPYVSLLLACGGKQRVVAEGLGLKRPELGPLAVRCFVEEAEVGTVTIAPGAPWSVAFALPGAVAGRPFVTVRFESRDWVYSGPDLRRHACFVLQRVALE